MNRALNTCADLCDYRYGFQGQEKDDEIKGKGNSYDFGSRMYDSRLARFTSLDPRMGEFAFQSPYAYALNNPIRFVDVDGEGPGDPPFYATAGALNTGGIVIKSANEIDILHNFMGPWIRKQGMPSIKQRSPISQFTVSTGYHFEGHGDRESPSGNFIKGYKIDYIERVEQTVTLTVEDRDGKAVAILTTTTIVERYYLEKGKNSSKGGDITRTTENKSEMFEVIEENGVSRLGKSLGVPIPFKNTFEPIAISEGQSKISSSSIDYATGKNNEANTVNANKAAYEWDQKINKAVESIQTNPNATVGTGSSGGVGIDHSKIE